MWQYDNDTLVESQTVVYINYKPTKVKNIILTVFELQYAVDT